MNFKSVENKPELV